MINFYVKGQELTTKQPVIIPYTVDYLQADFHFMTSIWDGLTKWAYFVNGEQKYPFLLQDDKITTDMHLNLSEGKWKVFLQGNDPEGTQRITAAGGEILVTPSGFDFTLPEIGLSATEQITATATRAETKAEQAIKTATDSLPFAERAEKAAEESEASAQAADQSETAAKSSALEAAASKFLSAQSAEESRQALSDLLRMLGTDIATLVGGKIPIEQIPATATQEIYTVQSQEELTGLDAQFGDLAEIVEIVDGVRTVKKAWQMLGKDPKVLENWVVWGTSYAVNAGHAETATNAENATMINGHRFVEFSGGIDQFKPAVKDPKTYYLVHDKEAEVQP